MHPQRLTVRHERRVGELRRRDVVDIAIREDHDIRFPITRRHIALKAQAQLALFEFGPACVRFATQRPCASAVQRASEEPIGIWHGDAVTHDRAVMRDEARARRR